MNKADTIVVGGGISGLSLAHYLQKKGQRVLVLDQNPLPGGCLHTLRGPQDFWVEAGAHTLYNSYGGVIEILDDLHMRSSVRRRTKQPYKLRSEGLQGVLSQMQWGELIRSLWQSRGCPRQGRTVQEYWSAKVGTQNYHNWLGTFLSAVPCQPAHHIPAEMLFRKRPRHSDLTRHFTLERGLQSLALALVEKSDFTHRGGVEVLGVRYGAENGWEVQGRCGDEDICYQSARLALAIDPQQGAQLLAADFPQLASEMKNIATCQVHSWAGVVARRHCSLPLLAGVVPLDLPVHSLVSRDVLPHPTLRGFAVHFSAQASRADWPGLVQALTGVEPRDWLQQVQTTHTLPAPAPQHLKWVDALRAALPTVAQGTLGLTGNWFDGLAIEECVQRSRVEAERIGCNH